ncbi:MAG: 5'-nucleotidase domain-containing protein [Erysipelotrichaceae bacterium]|nr:MAG: 5'-nucleotidase domain-containing protein [Erysipelotrichaceae bacterium]
MINTTSLTVVQMNDSHAYFDLHHELFWQGNKAVYRMAGGYARIATLVIYFVIMVTRSMVLTLQ